MMKNMINEIYVFTFLYTSHFGSNVTRRARLLYIRIYQSRTESLIYLSPLYRRLSPVYLNTSKEMEMYLGDSSSERKIIWHILKVGISLKLLKPPPSASSQGSAKRRRVWRGMVRLRAQECEVILKRFLPTEVYINWRFTKAYEQNFTVAIFYCLVRC